MFRRFDAGQRIRIVNSRIDTGTIATFTVGDVSSPDAFQVLRQAGPELEVRGTVVYLSDRGQEKNHFAIVDVGGIHAPLIVPVSRLRMTESSTVQAARPFAE